MEFSQHVNSIFNSISYRIKDVIIDPGDIWEGFNKIKNVLLTHAHFDHIYGLNELFHLSPDALVYTNECGREMLLNPKRNLSRYNETPFVFEFPEKIVLVENGEVINLNNGFTAKAVFTPGHNPSCITWVVDDMVFSGDSLIPGIKTVTNLPGGDKAAAQTSEHIIRQLAINRTLYPGHKTT